MEKFKVEINIISAGIATVSVYYQDEITGKLTMPTQAALELVKLFEEPHVVSQRIGVVGPGANVTGMKIDRLG